MMKKLSFLIEKMANSKFNNKILMKTMVME